MNGREKDLMTQDEMAAAVALLAAARRSGTRIEALNATPGSVAEGHAIQDGVTAALGETVGGFKANAPPAEAPVRGSIYARMIFKSPARMAESLPHKGVEGEIAFRFLIDLPARDTDYTRGEVVNAVAALAAVEVVSGRFVDPWSRPAMEQLADCLNNGALVLGSELTNWTKLDMAGLRVTAWVNGKMVSQQGGGHPINDPVAVAVALVNMMRAQGGVKAGQLVTTGSYTGIRSLQPGDHFGVAFEGLGGAEVILD